MPFPATRPRIVDRVSAWRGRLGPLLWMYLLVPVPLLTDWVENGALPTTLRGWLTEAVGGFVIAALVGRVRHDRRALESLARTDGLTGLFNRHAFAGMLDAECARAGRGGQPLSLVYFDIDRFKSINDRFGHAAGDQVLRQLATAVAQTVRRHLDAAFRLGGDEFALLLPQSDAAQAEAVVGRIRTCCAVHDPRWAVGAFDVSAGIVEYRPGESSVQFLARADAAMYERKAGSTH